MYLKRKVDQFLYEWKQDNERKPLIIRGCRQIGKTESILHFAHENYKNIVEINFVRDEKYKMITSDGYSVDDIIKNISRINPEFVFEPDNTLIFFDEITDYPAIATALKFFKIDGRYDVICSGYLLGLNYKQIESNSVGYKTDYTMFSMDFEEFLWAKGYDNKTVDDMLQHMLSLTPFNELEMSIYHELFLDFCILGGMPEVVKSYINKNTFENSLELQRQLIAGYKEDIRKYAEGLDQTRILNVFNSIAPQLAKENKKFQISKIEKGARYKDYRGCAEWLQDAGIVNMCYCLNFPELPISGNADISKFKLYFADTGLLVSLLDEETQDDLRANKNLGVYKGGLYENIVAEALHKAGYGLYYYKREDSTLEEDFFIRNTDNLIPVEVKAKSGRSKSMRTLIQSDRYEDVKFGFKLSAGNIGFSDNVYSFPYFCTFLMKRFVKEFKAEL